MTDFEKLVKANLGPPGDFMFSDKGKEISKLLQKEGIEGQKDPYIWFPVQWSCWLAESGKFEENSMRNNNDEVTSQIKAIENLRKFHKKNPIRGNPSLFDQSLAQYESELKKTKPRGGLIGLPLKHKGKIKKQSLLFHLTHAFHNFTGNSMGFSIGPIPEEGKPLYKLVADIAAIVLEDDSIDENSVAKIVRRLKSKNAEFFDPQYPGFQFHAPL